MKASQVACYGYGINVEEITIAHNYICELLGWCQLLSRAESFFFIST